MLLIILFVYNNVRKSEEKESQLKYLEGITNVISNNLNLFFNTEQKTMQSIIQLIEKMAAEDVVSYDEIVKSLEEFSGKSATNFYLYNPKDQQFFSFSKDGNELETDNHINKNNIENMAIFDTSSSEYNLKIGFAEDNYGNEDIVFMISIDVNFNGEIRNCYILEVFEAKRLELLDASFSDVSGVSFALTTEDGIYLNKTGIFSGTNFFDFLSDYNENNNEKEKYIKESFYSSSVGRLNIFDNKRNERNICYNVLSKNSKLILFAMYSNLINSFTIKDFFLHLTVIFFVSFLSFVDIRCVHILFLKLKAKIKELKEKTLEAEKANNAKTEFLSCVSHDMRTPMNSILGLSDLAISEANPSQEYLFDVLKKINKSGQYLLTIINETLNMSCIEKGKINIVYLPMKISEMVNSIVDIIKPQIKEKNLHFNVDYTAIPDKVILSDKGHLQQIIINILSNSIRFTPEGGLISLVFEVNKLREDGFSYVIHCADNGKGISSEFIDRIFIPFEQEDQSRTCNYGLGTGLGLSIVHNLVTLMNGKIEVESYPNKGTRFDIYFDVKYGSEGEKKILFNKNKTNQLYKLGYKVLLVEDNEINIFLAKKILENMNLEVDVANNGQIALDIFESSKKNYYNIILMDIRMPVMGGIEATKAIRALNRIDAKKIPIIAMTADTFDKTKEKCKDAGIDSFISKPIDRKKMEQTIINYLNNGKQ